MLGGEGRPACIVWCQELEKHASPAEELVSQISAFGRARLGAEWEGVTQQVDRAAADSPVKRLELYLQALLGQPGGLVVYLDNLESLLVGPDNEEGEAFGEWRSAELQAMWRLLAQTAQESDRVSLVASCRYRNPDLRGGLLPVSPLPADALYRLMAWFPAL